MAAAYTARLAQCPVADLLADPGLFARSFTESVAVLGLESLVIEIPVPAAAAAAAGGDPGGPGCAVLREDLRRLRATLRDRVAIVALLPGPLTLCRELAAPPTPDRLDDLVGGLIRLQEYLGPAEFDALCLLERAPVGDPDVPDLAGATSAFWNVARHYALPSLLVAAEGTARLAATGATAVAAWSGVTAAGLLAGGAAVAGEPPPARLLAGLASGTAAGEPPDGGAGPGVFYLTAGEIPAQWEVGAVRSLVRRMRGEPSAS
jgi:hypothetical protein